MPNLTSLTLDLVRLDDEDLDKICECFPGLQVLNLRVVGQLKDPQVRFLNLRSCNWTLVCAPNSVAVVAPKLQKLKIDCTRPNLLVLNTPVLEEMHLCILESNRYMVGELKLKSIYLESMELHNLIQRAFPYVNSVRSLTLWATHSVERTGTCVCLGSLSRNFPNLETLTLSPRVWSELEGHLCPGCLEVRTDNNLTELQRIIAYLVLNNVDTTLSFITAVAGSCPGLKEMALLIHRDVVSSVSRNVIAKCEAYCPRIRWRWGMWKEGTQDVWISDQLKSS
ncbi:unnamed protein product [Cuscuta campestris]|uniref:FBD domain-containing protein n=1 Tax=Cuscuta campestris TaxID=132261 RepID=A0A484KB74_9ASTE|nr:unnamed protein product [Cuscuta campestris]